MTRHPADPSPAQLAALARPVPRYTSYPPVPSWRDDVGAADLEAAIRGLDTPAAVYVHVPFCWKQCWYCGCNMVVSQRQAAGDRYLETLIAQLSALPLPTTPYPVSRIHLGGGTPTWLSPEQLGMLMSALRWRFQPIDGAELSIEVHPGVTTAAHLDVLASHGFRRLSIGVQSTDPQVLAAIGREQTLDDVLDVAAMARARGFTGLNVDLVYGLPHQTMHTLDRTLDAMIALRPDRLALYGYAHVPWLRPAQAKIDAAALPGPEARMALFLHAAERLQDAGWRALGLDHFALPDDALARAAAAGTLSRDFMGHTDRTAPLIGLGPSAISEIGDLYAQQPSHLGTWYRAVQGETPLPVAHGHRLTPEDALRRDAIRALMCNLAVDWDALGAQHGVDARQILEDAVGNLASWECLGIARVRPQGVEVQGFGRLLLRNLAACFDGYLADGVAAWHAAPVAASA